jgi:hypothetical protein
MGRRKGTRYLRILRGSDDVVRDRLIRYFKGEIKPTYPERRGNRPAPLLLWLDPLGLPLGDGYKLAQDVNSQQFPNISTFVQGFVDTAAPTAENRVIVPGLLTARAAITTGRTVAAGVDETSKITGRTYKKYGGTSVSVPFGEGATAALQNEDAVFKVILGRVKAASAANICSFVPGSYSPS